MDAHITTPGESSALGTRLENTGRVRRGVGHHPPTITRIAVGPGIGSRSGGPDAGESCTTGSAGGVPGKPTGGEFDTAPRFDPYLCLQAERTFELLDVARECPHALATRTEDSIDADDTVAIFNKFLSELGKLKLRPRCDQMGLRRLCAGPQTSAASSRRG